ncbi:MFS transporter [Clostridium frigidicarnis]|uniref:Fucose permease n=1 Tax=Clostridium frigidicarnis TaxID=84698 RepID=A0A1I1BC10_9CLOT|nr:MFS transporter [Clostridium frigidicarnis]SFB46268.1 Fucose permease [Clostridium frigidicarnis]
MENKKPHLFTIIFIFTMMILAAIAENTRGVLVPSFKADFGINDADIGFIFGMCTIGYSIASFLGGMLCEKVGQKKVFVLGILTMIVSMLLISFSTNYYQFVATITLSSCGLAFSAISINTLIPILFISMQSVIMNLVHFCYGLGSSTGQMAFGKLLYYNVSWRHIYIGVAGLYGIMLLLFKFIKIPDVQKDNQEEKLTLKDALSNKLVWFYIFALGFYVFAEGGTGNWFVNYMESSFDFNKSQSSTYLSIFFALFAIGRLGGGFVVEKMGYLNTVLKSLIIAFIIYTIGFGMGSNGVLIIGVSGIFFAITFPTVVLSISKVFTKGSTYLTGIIITFAMFISMIMNNIMGIVNQLVGTRMALSLIPISLVLSIISVSVIYRKTKDKLIIKK